MSVINKHNHKTFTKSPPAFLLHCIENILNLSFGKCNDSLTMATTSFMKSSGLCTQYSFTNTQLSARQKVDTNDIVAMVNKSNILKFPNSILGPVYTINIF